MATTSVPRLRDVFGRYVPHTRMHVCPLCQREFRPRARTSKYCSHSCAMKSRAVSMEVRFWRHVEKTETCWLWTSTINRFGYPTLKTPVGNPKRYMYAHRVSYVIHKGPIPEGLYLDHLCRVRHCVNPDHLEAVTFAENVRRGESPPAQNGRKTHCVHGHEFTPANTYIRPDGDRGCRTCGSITARRIHARKRLRY